MTKPPSAKHEKPLPPASGGGSEHAKPTLAGGRKPALLAGLAANPIVAQRVKGVPHHAGKLLREPAMEPLAWRHRRRASAPSNSSDGRSASRSRAVGELDDHRDPADYVSEPRRPGYRALHLINRHRRSAGGRDQLEDSSIRTDRQLPWRSGLREAFPGLHRPARGAKLGREKIRFDSRDLRRRGSRSTPERGRRWNSAKKRAIESPSQDQMTS